MKSAIYLENGTTQVVLTAENDFEKAALRAIDRESNRVTTCRGEFYQCRGGWHREGQGSESLILRLENSTQPNTPA